MSKVFSTENGIPCENSIPIKWKVPLAGIGIESRYSSDKDDRVEFIFSDGVLQGMVQWNIYDRKDAIDAQQRAIVSPLRKQGAEFFDDIKSGWASAHYARIRAFLNEKGIPLGNDYEALGVSGNPESQTQVYYWQNEEFCLKLPFNGDIQFIELPEADRPFMWHSAAIVLS